MDKSIFPSDGMGDEQGGLTKRELFAAMIAQGIVSANYDPDAGDAPSDDKAIAENAVGIADALITALATPRR